LRRAFRLVCHAIKLKEISPRVSTESRSGGRPREPNYFFHFTENFTFLQPVFNRCRLSPARIAQTFSARRVRRDRIARDKTCSGRPNLIAALFAELLRLCFKFVSGAPAATALQIFPGDKPPAHALLPQRSNWFANRPALQRFVQPLRGCACIMRRTRFATNCLLAKILR